MHADVRAWPWNDGRKNYCRDAAGSRGVADAQLESNGGRAACGPDERGGKYCDGGDAAMSAAAEHVGQSHAGQDHAERGFFLKYCWSTDHKMIAMQYLFTGMAMAVIGGYLAYVFRMQQGFPNQNVPGFGMGPPGRDKPWGNMPGPL